MLLQKHKVILLLWLVVTLHNSRLDQSSSSRSSGPHNGSITSSSQSSDESEDPSVSHNSIRNQRRQRGHYQQATGSYRSSSLPRHSSVSQYRRSITMPNIKSQMEPGSVSSYNNNSTLIGQIEPIRPPGPPPSHNNVQLTTWLQSLTGEDPYIRFHFIKQEFYQLKIFPGKYLKCKYSSNICQPLRYLKVIPLLGYFLFVPDFKCQGVLSSQVVKILRLVGTVSGDKEFEFLYCNDDDE